MPFFEDVDGLGIIERHIRRVTGLELEQSRNMLREYTAAKKDLIERLQAAPQGTFTEAQLESTLAQVEAGIQALNARLRGELSFGVEQMEEQSVEDTVKEIGRFEREFRGVSLDLPVQAILESLDKENLLLNRYQSSIDAYNESIRANAQRELTQAVIQRNSYLQAVQNVANVFPSFRSTIAWQVQRIVRTELHNVYNVSKMDGFLKVRDDFIPDLKKTLIHPMDTRTGKDSVALKRLNPIVPIDKPFRFKWRGETRVFMAPPDRPNDRAILVPYREEWNNG